MFDVWMFLVPTLSTVVDILAVHVVWYISRRYGVANALIQKFDVRGGDDALRSRLPDEGHRLYFSPLALARLALALQQLVPKPWVLSTCMYTKQRPMEAAILHTADRVLILTDGAGLSMRCDHGNI
jgi:hypothetical protein